MAVGKTTRIAALGAVAAVLALATAAALMRSFGGGEPPAVRLRPGAPAVTALGQRVDRAASRTPTPVATELEAMDARDASA